MPAGPTRFVSLTAPHPLLKISSVDIYFLFFYLVPMLRYQLDINKSDKEGIIFGIAHVNSCMRNEIINIENSELPVWTQLR